MTFLIGHYGEDSLGDRISSDTLGEQNDTGICRVGSRLIDFGLLLPITVTIC